MDGGGDTWNPWTDISGSDATTTRHTLSRLANGTGYTVALRRHPVRATMNNSTITIQTVGSRRCCRGYFRILVSWFYSQKEYNPTLSVGWFGSV